MINRRFSSITFTGITRWLVATGMLRLAVMFSAMRNAGPRKGTSWSPWEIGTAGAAAWSGAGEGCEAAGCGAGGGASATAVWPLPSKTWVQDGVDGLAVVLILLEQLVFEPAIDVGLMGVLHGAHVWATYYDTKVARLLVFSDIHNDARALERLMAIEADFYFAAGDLVNWGRGSGQDG